MMADMSWEKARARIEAGQSEDPALGLPGA